MEGSSRVHYLEIVPEGDLTRLQHEAEDEVLVHSDLTHVGEGLGQSLGEGFRRLPWLRKNDGIAEAADLAIDTAEDGRPRWRAVIQWRDLVPARVERFEQVRAGAGGI